MRTIKGESSGELLVKALPGAPYDVSISFNGETLRDVVTDYYDSEIKALGCEEWVSKIGDIWVGQAFNPDEI